jgi:g-D-glutamyl-meso-diaminopimelate peptidase
MTIQLSMAQIERYCKFYDKKINKAKVSKVLDKVAIHYIPSCNPDGTAISQFGFSAIKDKKVRKALRKMGGGSSRWKANARGVDLNRNWAIAWRHSGSRGAAGYRGPKAASEPEIKALVKWFNTIQKKQGNVVGIISYHSTGSILYGRCAGQASSKVKKQTTKMYKLARKLTGYRLMPTESISSARGCSREYFLYKRSIPFITLEIGHGSCPLGAGEFSSIWRKNKDLVLREAMLFD